MKMTMIAALAAAQLAAAAQAAELPREERTAVRSADAAPQAFATGDEALGAVSVAEGREAAAAREDRPRKRKSTGDKILTGAAVVLGVGALAVGGLLVAIFVG